MVTTVVTFFVELIVSLMYNFRDRCLPFPICYGMLLALPLSEKTASDFTNLSFSLYAPALVDLRCLKNGFTP